MTDYWLLIGDDWWLIVHTLYIIRGVDQAMEVSDDWLLIADWWWLIIDDWLLMTDWWWLIIDCWWLINDEKSPSALQSENGE